jgi:pyruvate formate lyase activating enzyme
MHTCDICHRRSDQISGVLGLCAACLQADDEAMRRITDETHCRSRRRFGLPAAPPRKKDGIRCSHCANACKINDGEMGYCGIRRGLDGRLHGGDSSGAAVAWYRDPLPTNCVADWVCPASTGAGYPKFTDTEDAEYGYHNLAVFYEACSFDCLFCQNWHFRERGQDEDLRSADDLAGDIGDRTRCVCFFGGDPSCQIEHALAAARTALEASEGRILRVCWESNGSVSRTFLKQMIDMSLASGGCIKFDLKAWDLPLHRALCGVSNRPTLANFEYVAGFTGQRPDPPLLIAATCLVPGYVDAKQVSQISRFVAGLNPDIPYALLAFHPSFEMSDLPTTSRQQATECYEAAKEAGLNRVRIGNLHLLR